MITIDFNTFNSSQNELKETCIDYIQNVIGEPDRLTISRENDQDLTSEYSLLFMYKGITIRTFTQFDELMDFARVNELYVVVYDHDENIRKGFWYDEQDEWVTQKIVIQQYLN